MGTPRPCVDCVEIHGDAPADWLAKWPAGAEFSERWRVYVCDGCADDREDHAYAAAQDMAPWETDPEGWPC